MELEVRQTDITTLEVDAIANAANTELLHGGGVAAVIERAGGDVVRSESLAAAPIGLGEAVETSAGAMPSRWVIHAATMKLDNVTSAAIIERATVSTLQVAERLGARSLGLVAFGTGVGRFPVDEAARLMVGACRAHQAQREERRAGAGRTSTASTDSLEGVVFAVHGDAAERAFRAAVES